MKRHSFTVINIIMLLLLLAGCEKDNIPTNNENESFSGITKTDENGIIIFDDLNDWQPTL